MANIKKIVSPKVPASFFYGPIISHEFHGGITKDKGKYRIRFTLHFKSGDSYKTQKSGFQTRAEATLAKDAMVADIVKQEYVPFQYTIKEVCAYWLYYYLPEEENISYHTYQTYKNVLYNYCIPSWGEKRLIKDITTEDIIVMFETIPYVSTKRNAVGCVTSLFGHAMKKHYIPFNPSLAAADAVKRKLPKKEKISFDIKFTVEIIKQMLSVCKDNYPQIYIPLLLALTTGVRISEMIAMKYRNLDFSKGTITVSGQLGRSMEEEEDSFILSKEIRPKTQNAYRTIPLPQWVMDELIVRKCWYEKQKDQIENFQDKDFICCKEDGSPCHRRSFAEDFQLLLSDCGLPHMRWHDLRHVYATLLKDNDVNMKALAVYLGHASPYFTEDVYILSEEKVYDCSYMQDIWEEIGPQTKRKTDRGCVGEFTIALTDQDYFGLLGLKKINNFSSEA